MEKQQLRLVANVDTRPQAVVTTCVDDATGHVQRDKTETLRDVAGERAIGKGQIVDIPHAVQVVRDAAVRGTGPGC